MLKTIPVKEVMTNKVQTTTPDTRLAKAANLMIERKIGCLPVIDGDQLVGMLSEGVRGYLLKDEAVEHVVTAVRAVARGEVWLGPQVTSKVVQRSMGTSSSQLGPDQLTKREMEVLSLMAKGQSNEEIAESLYITERTVRFHVSNLFSKLQVTSRVEAVVKAFRLQLVEM